MPILPEQLQRGRASFPGPVTGNPVSINLGPFVVAINSTDLIRGGIVMPFSMRLSRVSWSMFGAFTANGSFSINRHTSAFQVAGSDEVLSADVDVDATEVGRADPSGTTPTIAVRELNRGDRVFVAITTDATGTNSGASQGPLCVQLMGFITGVVNLNEAND